MKIALCFAVLVLAYIIYSTNAQLSVKSTPQRRSQPRSQQRSLFIKSRRNRRITNLLKVPSIICYYAKYGKWPEYDQILQSLVLQFSQIVFAMNDESIRFYCNQVYKFNQFFRPLARPREATTTIFPNRNFQTIAINFGTLPPTTSSFITSTLAPTTTRTTATLRPLTNVLTTPTTTIRPNGLTTITSTTTTTAAPSASGIGDVHISVNSYRFQLINVFLL